MKQTHLTYYKGSTLKKLQGDLQTYKEYLEILQGIRRTYKKDGGDFQSFLKNFDAGDSRMYFSYDDVNVTKWINGHCQTVSIRYMITSKEKVEEIGKKEPERIVKSDFLIDRVYPTANEFMEIVQELVDFYKERIGKLETAIASFDDTIETLETHLEPIKAFLDSMDGNIYREFRDLLKRAL